MNGFPAQKSLFPKTRYVIPLIIGGLFVFTVSLYLLRNILSENTYWLAKYSIDIIYALIMIRVLKQRGINLFQSKIRSPARTFLKTGALMLLCIIFALGVVSFLSLLLPDVYYDEDVELVKFDPLYVAVAGFLSMAVIAPLWEEMAFRGIILNRWKEKWNPTRAILASSFIFALFHPLNIIGAFLFSLVLSIQYIRTKNILIAIVGHGFTNSILYVLFLTSYLTGLSDEPLEIPTTSETVLFGSICIALSLPILVYWLKKNWPKATE